MVSKVAALDESTLIGDDGARHQLAKFTLHAKRPSGKFPVLRNFVVRQLPKQRNRRVPGPMSHFTSAVALDLYLLLSALATERANDVVRFGPYSMALSTGELSRALGLATRVEEGGDQAAIRTVQKALKFLATRRAYLDTSERNSAAVEEGKDDFTAGLIELGAATVTHDLGRIRPITLMDPGFRRAFPGPLEKPAPGNYFRVPLGWFEPSTWRLIDEGRRKLHARQLLLVALANTRSGEDSEFEMSARDMHAWYGLSADSLRRGRDALEQAGWLKVESRREATTKRSHAGFRYVDRYTVNWGKFRQPSGPWKAPKQSAGSNGSR